VQCERKEGKVKEAKRKGEKRKGGRKGGEGGEGGHRFGIEWKVDLEKSKNIVENMVLGGGFRSEEESLGKAAGGKTFFGHFSQNHHNHPFSLGWLAQKLRDVYFAASESDRVDFFIDLLKCFIVFCSREKPGIWRNKIKVKIK